MMMNGSHGSKEVPTTPLSHEVASFLHRCIERNLALTTLSTYTQVLNSFAEFMQEHHVEVSSIAQICPPHLQQFRHHLRLRAASSGREFSLRTQAKYLAAIRSLLRYYSLEGRLPVMSRDQVVLPKLVRVHVAARLTRDDVVRLLEQPNAAKPWGARDRAIIALLACTGVRVSELCALNKKDVRPSLLGDCPDMAVAIGGSQPRHVVLNAQTQSLVKQYLDMRDDNYPPLFIRHKPGKADTGGDSQHRLTRQMVDRMLVRYAEAAHLPLLPSARDIARLAKE